MLGPSTVLLIAEEESRVVGTGQLDLAMRANGRNRAEVCKVLVLPSEQGKGIVAGLSNAGMKQGGDYELMTYFMDTRVQYTTTDRIKSRATVSAC